MAVRLTLLLQLSLLFHCFSMHQCGTLNCVSNLSSCFREMMRSDEKSTGERYLPSDLDEMEVIDLPEDVQNQIVEDRQNRQQQDPKRNSVDKNFLRFGRSSSASASDSTSSTDKRSIGAAILPAYRRSFQVLPFVNGIRQQRELMANSRLMRELSNKRGTLDKNFLRFGRSSNLATADSSRRKRDAEEREEEGDEVEESNFRWKREGYYASLPEYLEMEKRGGNGKQDTNFLRFGRMLASPYEMKRGADKNFLRFGRSRASSRESARRDLIKSQDFLGYSNRK